MADFSRIVDQRVDEPFDAVAPCILVPPFEPRCGGGSEVLACDAYERVVCDGDYALVVVVEAANQVGHGRRLAGLAHGVEGVGALLRLRVRAKARERVDDGRAESLGHRLKRMRRGSADGQVGVALARAKHG